MAFVTKSMTLLKASTGDPEMNTLREEIERLKRENEVLRHVVKFASVFDEFCPLTGESLKEDADKALKQADEIAKESKQ